MKKYIAYEMNEIRTEAGWRSWFAENGDKENFADADCWWSEMKKYGLLVEVQK